MKRIIVFNIGTDTGGIETSMIQFLRFLVLKKCQVDLVLWKKPGEMFDKIPEGVNVLPSPAPGGWNSLLSKKKITQKIIQLKRILDYKIDIKRGCAWEHFTDIKKYYDVAISYCQNGYSPYYVIDKVFAKKYFMFYHHGSYDASAVQYEKDKSYYSKYNKIITVSEANKNMLSLHFPELQDKIFVVHNLIDMDEIRLLARETVSTFNTNGICRIATVGRISAEKGQLFALEIARELKARKFPFEWVFIGEGPEKNNLISKTEQFGLEDNCFFIGSKKNPYPWMSAADIYVQNSYVEADPIAIREAMVLLKPIIASDIPAIRETLHNGIYGAICKFSAYDFASEIVELYTSEFAKEYYINNLSCAENQNEASEHLLEDYIELLN